MDQIKTKFLSTHHGYFFPEGADIPINSKGMPDADTFLLYLINEGTRLITHFYSDNIIHEVSPEMKDIIYYRIIHFTHHELIRKIKPKQPKLFIPQSSSAPVDQRLQIAINYYNECKKSVYDAYKIVLDTINMGYHETKESIIERLQSEVSATLNDEEIEAVIMYINPKDKTFRKNTLLALKVLNRFAKEQEIRFEDAVTVFSDYID